MHQQQQQQQPKAVLLANTTTTTTTTTTRTSRLQETWQDFQRALRSIHEPFNPFIWILRLFLALVHDIYISIPGLNNFVVRYRRYGRACIPIFALNLIILVILSYPLSIRHKLIQPRWCSSSASSSSSSLSSLSVVCKWIYLHDGLVFYLGFMILYHYIATIFTSPGVALPSESTTTTTSPVPASTKWSAINSQGGVLGWNAVCNMEQERQRVQLYGPLSLSLTTTTTASSTTTSSATTIAAAAAANDKKKKKKSNNNKNHDEEIINDNNFNFFYFPSVHASYCEKCQIIRPPRCHHCNVCHRCVLQYDHHCIWVNSCIGYNNYRHFVLLLFFLMLGCWYGVCMLFFPFYEPLRQQIRKHGLHWLYSNKTGFLDLPTPTKLLHMIFWSSDGLPVKIVVDLVYPLLLGVGAILSGFLGFHVQYILKGRTTLEHKIILQDALVNIYRQGQQQQQRTTRSPPPTTTTTTDTTTPVPTTTSISNATNPFDQGYYKNLQQILGPNLLRIFLPVSISPPAPYLPSRNTGTSTHCNINSTTSRSRKEC